MESKICYVAGPYTAPDSLQIESNILEAKFAVREVIDAGMIPLAPTLCTARFDWYMPDVCAEWWYGATLELLKRCDAIWLFGHWEKSVGAKLEVKYAFEHGMPIYEHGKQLDGPAWAALGMQILK